MNFTIAAMAEKARRLPPWSILALGFLWVSGVGVLDCLMPSYINFSLLYLPGIAWVAWGIGAWPAAVLGVIAAVVITVTDFSFVTYPLPEGLVVWNVVTRFIVFAVVGWLTANLSRLTRHLASLVEQRTLALEQESAQHQATSAQLAEAMDLARLAHWEYEVASGRFTFDDRFYALYGTSAKAEGAYQMSPETYIREFLYPEDGLLVQDGIAGAVAAAAPHYTAQVEHRIRRRDGEVRFLSVHVALTKDAAGRTVKVHGVNQDITERKHAEAQLREAHHLLEQRVKERTAELQAANAALRESEGNYRRLYNSMRDAFVRVDLSGRLLEFNPAFEALLGYSAEELRQFTFMEVTPDKWHAGEATILATQVLTRGFSGLYEKEYRRRDGTVFPVELCAFLLHHADGQPAGMAAIVRDITERKQIEGELRRLNETLEQRVEERTAALRESEARFRTLSRASFEGVFLSQNGRIVDCNDQALAITGYPRQELLGRDLLELVPPEWKTKVRQLIQEGRQATHEQQVLCKDGTRRIVEIHGHSPNGPTGLRLSAVRDITERKTAEQRLADALELNRALIAHAPIGIAAYKADGQCIQANEAMAQVVGGSIAEVSQQNFRQLESWRRSPLLATAETVLRTGQAQHCEFRDTTTLGRKVYLSAHFVSVANKGEAHLLLLVRDITEAKQAEKLLQAQRNLGIALSLTNDLGTAFACLLDAAMHLEAIDCGGIYMLEANSGGMRLAAHRGVSQSFVEQVCYHAPELPQTRLMRQGQPLYTLQSHPTAQTDTPYQREGLQALALVPLCYENTVIGCLTLASHTAREIPAQTRVALEAIAAQTAGAIARIKAETALHESERRLRTIITGAPLFVFAVDHQGRITFEDGQALKALGVAPGQFVGKKVEEVYAAHPLVLENMRRALQGEEFSSTIDLGPIALDCWYSPTRDPAGNVIGYTGVATNITERLRLERQLLEVSEREQARMGQDIHDGLCQQLVSLAFDANALERQLAARQQTEAALARRIADYLDQAITETRQLSRGLFPIRLDGEGLPSALEELARTTSDRFRLRCECQTGGPLALKDQAMATHLYRIVQEALNNALKHGRPRAIAISLHQRAGWLELRVADDGVGLPPRLDPNSRGMGLHIMDYRARSFGGRLELSRNPAGGTTVCCCVPCQNR